MADPLAQRLADATVDRRRLKRRLVWWRSIAIVVVIAALAAGGWFFLRGETLPPGGSYIARVPITGIIEDDPKLVEHLGRLAENSRVSGVMVTVNSPGGTFSGSEALYYALRDLSNAKPTAAVVGGMAASGGYMAAIATDHIVARSGSITGSVGVIFQMPNVHRLLDDLGIRVETVRSGPLKARPSPLEPVSGAALDATERLINDLFNQFVGFVTERRTLSESALEQVTRGGVFTGRRGQELGLVDALGGEREARQWMATARGIDPETPVVDRPMTDETFWWQELLENIESRARVGATPILDGPWAIWHQ